MYEPQKIKLMYLKHSLKVVTSMAFLLFFFSATLWAQADNDAEKPQTSNFTIGDKTISLNQAIELVIRNSPTLQSARYDVLMSDSNYNQFMKKFGLNLSTGFNYNYGRYEMSEYAAMATGDKRWQWSIDASLAKIFESGTTLAIGVKELMVDTNDQNHTTVVPYGNNAIAVPVSSTPAMHKPVIFFRVEQELLKNAFGMNDRKTKKMLKNATQMQHEALIYQLSALVVSTLADYWSVTINQEALKNSQKEYDNTVQVRNIIARNLRVGLAESYELNQYNALVSAGEMKLDLRRQRLNDSVRKLIRTINLPADTKVEGVTSLITTPVKIDLDKSIETAYAQRTDYTNLQKQLENALMQKDIARNNSWPSLKASLNVTGQGVDKNSGKAFGETFNGKYPIVDLELRLTYPLWDLAVKNDLRNADYKVKQLRIQVEQKKTEIRDDVMQKVELLNYSYDAMQKNREILKESELFYNKLLDRSRRGKANAVVLKNAIDSLTSARQNSLESLVQYNVAILQYDLALNQIFRKYNIDIEKILQETK